MSQIPLAVGSPAAASAPFQVLSNHVPKLGRISKHLFVEFEVFRFRAPRLVWLNDRWLLQQGINIFDRQCRAQIEAWLLDTYAVSVPSPDEPLGLYSGDPTTMCADRYGLAGGMMNGGSGRVGTIGAFNAKGIGRTPLVSDAADWYHSNGHLWLEEAIREAINSEIVAAEFPFGAVPVLAILDPQERIHWNDGTIGERRAILVRPNFVRLGHFQRSIFFGSAGTSSSDQYLDARRVEDVFEFFLSPRTFSHGGCRPRVDLLRVFQAIGVQFGFARAAKLWPGPFLDNNVAIDGRLIDFGTFRSLPNWGTSIGEFGPRHPMRDDERVLDCAKSLSRSFAKYGLGTLEAKQLHQNYHRGWDAGFERYFHEHGKCQNQPLSRSIRQFYEHERLRRTRLAKNEARAEYGLFAACAENADRPNVGLKSDTDKRRLGRLLLPRPELDREQLLESTKSFLDDHYDSSAAFTARLKAYIERVIGRSMRHWAGLAEDFDLAAQSHHGHYSWLVAARSRERHSSCILRGLVAGDHFHGGERALPVRDLTKRLRVLKDNVADLELELEGGEAILPSGDRLKCADELFRYPIERDGRARQS